MPNVDKHYPAFRMFLSRERDEFRHLLDTDTIACKLFGLHFGGLAGHGAAKGGDGILGDQRNQSDYQPDLGLVMSAFNFTVRQRLLELLHACGGDFGGIEVQ